MFFYNCQNMDLEMILEAQLYSCTTHKYLSHDHGKTTHFDCDKNNGLNIK